MEGDRGTADVQAMRVASRSRVDAGGAAESAPGRAGRSERPRIDVVEFGSAVLDRTCPERMIKGRAVSEATERSAYGESGVLTVSLLAPPLVSVQTTWDGLQGQKSRHSDQLMISRERKRVG